MAAGSIIIDLLMKTGSFITDNERARKELDKLKKEAIATGKELALGVGAVAAGAAAAVAALDKIAGSIAQYQDLADKIGDTASAASGLQRAADLSGTALDTVSAASVRLTDALAKTDDEAKGAGAALKALNLPLDEFRKLSPVEQLEEVAKRLQDVENGSDRTAIAVALFGRAGADLIPFLNDLAEVGSKNARLTEEQIAAADRFSKQLAGLRSDVSTTARAMAADLFPALQVVFDEISGGATTMRDTSAAAKFLRGEVIGLAEAYVFLASGIERAAKFGALGVAAAVQVWQRRYDTLGDLGAAFREDMAATEARYASLLNRLRSSFSSGDGRRGASSDPRSLTYEPPPPPRRGPSFNTAGGGSSKDKTTEAQRYLENLQRQLDRTRELSTTEQVLSDLQSGRLKLSGDVSREQLLAVARQIDASKQLTDQLGAEQQQYRDFMDDRRRQLDEQLSAEARQYQDFLDHQRSMADAAKSIYEATRTPQERLAAELDRINVLLEKGAITWDTYGRAVFQAQDNYDAAIEKSKELEKNNYADMLGDSLGDFITRARSAEEAVKDFVATWLRQMARVAANNLANAVFGQGGGGGGGGKGLFGTVLGAVFSGLFGGGASGAGVVSGGSGIQFRAAGGPVAAGSPYVIGERGPELFIPNTAGRVLPNDMLRGSAGPKENLTIVNQTTGRVDRVIEQRISPTERALIIQEAADRAWAMPNDPNSKASKTLQANYRMQRNR